MPEWYDSEPLGWSASMGRLANTRELILLGADPLRPANKAGNTPLADAKREGYQDVVTFLEEYQKHAKSLATAASTQKLQGFISAELSAASNFFASGFK